MINIKDLILIVLKVAMDIIPYNSANNQCQSFDPTKDSLQTNIEDDDQELQNMNQLDGECKENQNTNHDEDEDNYSDHEN